MTSVLPGIVKVEQDAVWRVFYFNPSLLAMAGPLKILADLENDIASKQELDRPTPEPMESSVALLPNVKTPWIPQETLDRLAISRVWLETKDPYKEQFEDSCLFAFPRHHLSLHPASRVNQSLQALYSPVDYEKHTISTSQFQVLLKELDVHVFKDLDDLLRNERYLTSGASFDVSVAIAKSNSQFPRFSDGSARHQWVEGSVIALKRIRPPETNLGLKGSIKFPRVHRSMIHELRILNHPPLRNRKNLINLFGIGWEKHLEDGGIIYMRPVFVQSCATRGNLRDYLRAMKKVKQLPWQTKMLFCKDILDGLAALHASNVIHGDIKCDNILLEEGLHTELVAKLTDFGFSVIVPIANCEPVEEVEVLGGTKEYMAPEIYLALQKRTITVPTYTAFSSDIYTFGILAFEIALDGQYVFTCVLGPNEAPDTDQSNDQDEKARAAWVKSKIQPNADDLLLHPLKVIIDRVKEADEYHLSAVLDMTFRRHAEDRAEDITSVRSVLVGYDERATIPRVEGSKTQDKRQVFPP